MTVRRNPHPEERPALTPETSIEVSVRDSFPASDPPAPTVTQGARAVPPEEMMRDDASSSPPGAVRVTRHFPDAESAKLALETLVREGPIDRHSAEILADREGAVLALTVAPTERARVEAMLGRLAQGAGRG